MLTTPDADAIPTQAQTDIDQEQRWLRQAAREGVVWFAPIYDRYAARIRAYCLRRVRSVQDADDLTSQTFMQALTHLHDYRGGLVSAWLFRIAHRLILNHVRAQGRYDRRVSALDDRHPDPESAAPVLDALITDESHAELARLISALPDDQQNLLYLRITAGLSAREIGAIVGKREGAVRTALYRLFAHLQTQLDR